MTTLQRRSFIASALAIVVIPRMAAGVPAVSTETAECPYVYPVGVWLTGLESAPAPIPVDPRCLPEEEEDDDPEIIEVSAVDLRGL